MLLLLILPPVEIAEGPAAFSISTSLGQQHTHRHTLGFAHKRRGSSWEARAFSLLVDVKIKPAAETEKPARRKRIIHVSDKNQKAQTHVSKQKNRHQHLRGRLLFHNNNSEETKTFFGGNFLLFK